jgi:hypothetical protein
MRGISRLAEKLLAFQEGLCSMELVSSEQTLRCTRRTGRVGLGLNQLNLLQSL